MGDDIQKIVNDKALMLINHQSTSDVPLIMAALDGRSRNIMWIMDRMFMKTNFGVVSWFHKDFFISSVCSHHSHRSKQPYMHWPWNLLCLQGKARREQSLTELTVHLSNVYMPCKRTWILLFPEGGFLRKRREISRKFALQNSLPILHHTTIPRVGAVQNVVATIGPQRARMMSNGNGNLSRNARCVSHSIWTGGWCADANFSGFCFDSLQRIGPTTVWNGSSTWRSPIPMASPWIFWLFLWRRPRLATPYSTTGAIPFRRWLWFISILLQQLENAGKCPSNILCHRCQRTTSCWSSGSTIDTLRRTPCWPSIMKLVSFRITDDPASFAARAQYFTTVSAPSSFTSCTSRPHCSIGIYWHCSSLQFSEKRGEKIRSHSRVRVT